MKSSLPFRWPLGLLALVIVLCAGAHAGTYYVSPAGTAPWSGAGNCTDTLTPCSLATANTNAAAGDLVYFRGGTYTTSAGLSPAHSGTSAAHRITYAAYAGETPIITYPSGGSTAVNLHSYTRITGFTITDTQVWVRLQGGASYNEIDHNTFYNSAGFTGSACCGIIFGGAGDTPNTHNWIHNNTLHNMHAAADTCTDDGADLIRIGQSTNSGNDNYNTVESNLFYSNAHSSLDTFGMYQVVRNNIFHNEPWLGPCSPSSNPLTYTNVAYNGLTGHRNFQISDYYARESLFDLVEGNRSGYASVNPANDGADDLSLAGPGNIVRYNMFYAGMNPGILLKYRWTGTPATPNSGNGGTYNRIYNNTFYKNGEGYPNGQTSALWHPWPQSAISLYNGTPSGAGNVLKNNLMYLSVGYTTFGADVLNKSNPTNNWAALGAGTGNNWCTGVQSGSGCSAYGNPQFTNPDISSPSNTTLPDLSLQGTAATNPAIDGGTWLTTANNSGNGHGPCPGGGGCSLGVNDALYFQDGTWGSSLAKTSTGLGGTMQADWICVGTVSDCAQISSVTYGAYNAPAGTLTLASPLMWTNSAHVWLYKKSDGSVVLNGAAPDYGASESTAVGPPAVTLNPGTLAFGNQGVGVTSASQPVTLTNSGTGPLTISSIAASGDFAQTHNCPISPTTLVAGANCAINVTFTPTALGSRTGTLIVTDDATTPVPPHAVDLSGTGTHYTKVGVGGIGSFTIGTH